ncbi:MAG: nucleotidyltransferase family protein [Promethearchaeota archaeon]|nr:MAG: nucleotidyltransferase family protein [Candidatus Lokiarchaeota archaeon]
MKAIILCAGYGTRMHPYTETYQKTMLQIHGKPILEYLLEGLKYAGFSEFILVVGYLKEQIIEYFQEGKKWDISIEYVEQKNLNGTGGAVLLCEENIDKKHFFLTWGDIIVPYEIYREVYQIFKNEDEDFILVTNYLENLQKGCAIFCSDKYCTKMVEKPPANIKGTNLNNCGIFILSTEIFEVLREIPPSERGELEIPDAISYGIKTRGWKVRIVKMKKDQFRADFGDLDVYEQLKNKKTWIRDLKK